MPSQYEMSASVSMELARAPVNDLPGLTLRRRGTAVSRLTRTR
jgi:hypothetical protein